MATVASRVPFHQLCVLLDKINDRKGTDAKKKLLKEFIDEWRSFHLRLHKDDPNTNDSFYPAMRLLIPQLEREREAYGIKEHTLAKQYIDILQLGKQSADAHKLLNYRAPRSAKGDAGDFASVAYWVLKPRCPEKGTMTIEEVNRSLDKVAECNAARDREGVRKNLRHMLQNMSAREQKWLIRMVMKELKMGISQASVFSIYHQDSEDLYNVKMSLEKVCLMLRDPSVRLHEVEISVFTPFRPMLGDRGTPNQTEKMFNSKPFLIETKFDGERMQLHKDGDNYKFFSRSGNEYTHVYGGTPFEGNFTPFIANCFKDHVNSVILDGEMVAYDSSTKTIGYKGQNLDMKTKDSDKGFQPMMYVFDILLLNDEVLSNKTLRERKKSLENVFNPIEGKLILSEWREGSTKQDCVDALNDAIDTREEGIMVKDPESVYKPNTRKGGWYKVKPEYVGGLMDELDVLVVGGFFGSGSRSRLMSHFLCAVAVPPEDGGKPTEFHSFCKVGSGYSRKELYDFNYKVGDNWQLFNKKNPPPWLKLAAGLKQRPDGFIEPAKSTILQIKAAEITASDQYKTGCTLRFPRVEKIREDKKWYDCMTTTELEDLQQKSAGKLTGGHVDMDEEDGGAPKKRRKIVTSHVRPTVMAKFKGVDASSVTKVSEIFADKEICVINGPSKCPKSDIEKKIIEFGGSIAQNPGSDTYCVIADKQGIKVKNIISKGVYDVVKADWFLKCADAKRILPWVPSDMMHTSPKTAAEFALLYDSYGDSYCDYASLDDMKKAFGRIDEEGAAVPVSSEDIADIEMRYFSDNSQLGLFRLCKCYLDQNLELNEPSTHIRDSTLELVALELRFYGATLSTTLDDSVSHVVVDSKNLDRVTSLREVNRRRSKKFHLVTQEWVYDSMKDGETVSERRYDPGRPL